MPELSSIKLIPVGQGSQSRIAQACDRCRSKKIKCDGLRPSCSQCAAVDFECKTSDKLSRRAFPRGYTENLEVRVRDLEKANRELKFELESQEEKIAFLSKGPQQSVEASQSVRGLSTERCASIGPLASRDAIGAAKDGSPGMSPGVANLHSASSSKPSALKCFKTQPPTLHLDVESSDSFFMGASSGRPSIETFRRQLQERAKSCPSFNADAFLHILGCPPLVSGSSPPVGSFTLSPFPGRDAEVNAGHPPRIFTDQCVSVFFTEWAPFFPVLHRTDFLTAYALFTKDPERVKDTVKLCQIHLVFCIAGLSSDQPEIEIISGCEEKWKTLLNTLLCSQTVDILQCLVLAMIYCMLRGNHRQVQYYRSIAVGIAQRLGLHHQQRNFSFGVLTLETRKKVFWTLYTVDCFAAASMGLPRLINDHWVQTEYPIDADDHNVSENGIQPGLPNARTTMSNALALFQAMRCMAKVLDYAYSSCAVNISIPKLQELDSEIISWEQSLPSHQRLVFVGDSAELVHSDNALNASILAITYYYIRILITRLIIDNKTPQCLHTAIISVSRFSRRIIKISQCLEERRQAFAICLNKADLLALAGFSVLFEGVTINQASSVKLSPITANATLQNAVPFIDYVVKTLFRLKAPGCQDFKQAAAAFVRLEGGQCQEGPEERDLSLHRPRSETGTMTTTGTKGTKGSLFRGSPLHQNSTSSVALHHKLKLASARNSISGPVLPSMLYEGAKSDFDMPSASSQSSLFVPPASSAAASRSRRMTLAGPMRRPVLGHAAINLHQSGIMPSAPGDIGYELYSRPMEEDTPASLKPTAFSDFPGTAGAFFLGDTFSDSPLQTEDWFDAIYGNLHPKAAPLMWVNHDDVPSTEGPPSLAGVSVQSHITEELPQRPATVTLGAQGNNGKDGIPGLSGDILEGLVGFT